MKGGILSGSSEVTPSNEFLSTNASETVSTNCGFKLAKTNYIFNNSKFSNSFNFNFVNKNKSSGNCNEDVELSKADSDLDLITDEDVKALSFLNFLYTNPTSLNNKMLELQENLELGDFPHLVFITETWFKPETDDKPGSMVELNGYDLHRWDRSNTERGREAFYVRSDLISIEVMDQNLRGILVGLFGVGARYRQIES